MTEPGKSRILLYPKHHMLPPDPFIHPLGPYDVPYVEGMQPDRRDKRGKILMEYAKTPFDVKFLVNLKATVFTDETGCSILEKVKDTELIHALIKAKAPLDHMSPSGTSPLLRHIVQGNHDIVRLLLHYRANPNVIDFNGSSSLLLCHNYEIVIKLLESGADINIYNHQGYGPLHCCNDIRVAKVLLHCKARINYPPDNPPLCGVITNYNLVDFYLQNGAKANVFRVLHGVRDIRTLNLLIRYNADINIRSPDTARSTLLHRQNYGESVYTLLQAKCDITQLDNNGETALHTIARPSNDTGDVTYYLIREALRVMRKWRKREEQQRVEQQDYITLMENANDIDYEHLEYHLRVLREYHRVENTTHFDIINHLSNKGFHALERAHVTAIIPLLQAHADPCRTAFFREIDIERRSFFTLLFPLSPYPKVQYSPGPLVNARGLLQQHNRMWYKYAPMDLLFALHPLNFRYPHSSSPQRHSEYSIPYCFEDTQLGIVFSACFHYILTFLDREAPKFTFIEQMYKWLYGFIMCGAKIDTYDGPPIQPPVKLRGVPKPSPQEPPVMFADRIIRDMCQLYEQLPPEYTRTIVESVLVRYRTPKYTYPHIDVRRIPKASHDMVLGVFLNIRALISLVSDASGILIYRVE